MRPGGPPTCPWTTNDCGPSDEPSGFHTGGLRILRGDGTARFLSESIDDTVCTRRAKRNGGLPLREF